MHFSAVCRVLGILLMILSLSHVPPLLIDIYYDEGLWSVFLASFSITLITGFCIWLPVRKVRADMRIRDGYLITALFWTVLGAFGAVPFILSDVPAMSFTDSIFEAFSGLSTTGATVLTGLDNMPHSILYYRQQLQWLGGMGIVVLAVAIMPMLGVGGMQLYRTEIPGPLKDKKIAPRIADTAKTLWVIYCGLTLICALAYWAAGMSLFDAIGHSFSTIAIGGFSTHDASIGFFNSPMIELICIFFMAISGINFALHFLALRTYSLKHYWEDAECMAYLKILGTLFLICAGMLMLYSTYESPIDSIRYALFQVVSVATTTGFGIADFSTWPTFVPYLLLFSVFIGACAGSTGGGMKVMRVMLVFRQGQREIARLLHPNGVFTIKLGKHKVSDRVMESIWGFCAIYMGAFFTLMLALLACGLDPITAFSTLASCMNNLGPAFGDATANFSSLPDSAKYILSFAMVLGRLEVFSLLVLISPAFWRY
ncbi:TrkH family potassium uptake protein [Pseudomonas sp. F1_0610]|uniref:TrkH family potassium uptake protein n=1 Tax=Pseudomonas sp. F1_0610 TaxID=3114284 RepID=UPI0039C19FF6